jgi:hypothetical protein
MDTTSDLATARAKYDAKTAEIEAAYARLDSASDAELLREAIRALALIVDARERAVELPVELREADAAAWAERAPEIRTRLAVLDRAFTNLAAVRLDIRRRVSGQRRTRNRSAPRRPRRRTRRSSRGSPARSTDDDPSPADVAGALA